MKRRQAGFLAALLCCGVLLFCGGCSSKALTSGGAEEFCQKLREEWPMTVSGVTVEYAPSFGLEFSVQVHDLEDAEVYAVLGEIRDFVSQKSFYEAFFEEYCSAWKPDGNWDLGWRPRAGVRFSWQGSRLTELVFDSGYYLENYNSGLDPDSYTFDGYRSWRGTDYRMDHEAGVSVSAQQVEQKIEESRLTLGLS